MAMIEILYPTLNSSIWYNIDHLLTPEFSCLLSEAIKEFGERIREVFVLERQERLLNQLRNGVESLRFPPETFHIRTDPSWRVVLPPKCLERPTVDLGDVDPSNEQQLHKAFKSNASGVQVDFDDGFCPNFANVLNGHINIYNLCRHHYKANSPKLKLRPRSWNMLEENLLVDGCPVHGALFDVLLHLIHNGNLLYQIDGNVFFYLPKLESYHEASVWAELFHWLELRLNLPSSTIRGIVLIESISAVFEMHEILYELRNYCGGLNCGIWDYSASFITRLGSRSDSELFPDRMSYTSDDALFLTTYRSLLISICQERGAPSTGGMLALAGSQGDDRIHKAIRMKEGDFNAGAYGALTYDSSLIIPLLDLFLRKSPLIAPISITNDETSLKHKLIGFDRGKQATFKQFCLNVEVTCRFIVSWLNGHGHLIVHNQVEDSATAEISRAQVWQQIRRRALLHFSREELSSYTSNNSSSHGELSRRIFHRMGLEDRDVVADGKLLKVALGEVAKDIAIQNDQNLPTSLIFQQIDLLEKNEMSSIKNSTIKNRVNSEFPENVIIAYHLGLELLTLYQCPPFITSWLQQRGVLRGDIRIAPLKL